MAEIFLCNSSESLPYLVSKVECCTTSLDSHWWNRRKNSLAHSYPAEERHYELVISENVLKLSSIFPDTSRTNSGQCQNIFGTFYRLFVQGSGHCVCLKLFFFTRFQTLLCPEIVLKMFWKYSMPESRQIQAISGLRQCPDNVLKKSKTQFSGHHFQDILKLSSNSRQVQDIFRHL